ncbi:hypothetical protein QOZ80_5AG0387870 [Eleusine coracana subsp. coracana]|nr:hypothetical protein QOZ80_5AG0387870 [Eleusine coracana subsp. coracana]
MTNVLGVCAPDMQFIYVLPGWEGSAHDGRVLRDAVSRPNGLRVPQVMDFSESSTTVRGRGKNKRKWVAAEDDELIKALHEVSLDPKWRSDGSFKNGYMLELEVRLAEKLPDARISAFPHVDSRLRHFKTKYSALEQMLSKSGFTWDENKKMLQCEKQQYEDHCKNHPDAKGLYGVQFPYYNVLAAIYAKDTTTGEGAEDMSDAINNMEQELAIRNENNEEEEEDRTSRETPRRFFDSTSSSLGKMAQAMEDEAAIQEKAMSEVPKQKLREQAINEVRRLEFTGAEVIEAALVFVKMPEQMGMLFVLPEPLRREYIVNMLRDEARRKEREDRFSR